MSGGERGKGRKQPADEFEAPPSKKGIPTSFLAAAKAPISELERMVTPFKRESWEVLNDKIASNRRHRHWIGELGCR